ncbi:MAG: DUF3443 family protein [Syntrophales bacterium]|nr:DUF3443 family protein [Syntrophales bacterium]
MKSSNLLFLLLIIALATGCGGGGSNATPKALVSLSVAPTNPSTTKGTIQQFTATGTYSDSSTQNLTTSVTWSSSVTSVASISNATGSNGTADALAAGTTTITAASGNVSGSTTLTVTPPAPLLLSIAVSPSNPSIAIGTTKQFTATGTYSDNSTQNITTSATWSSSVTSVASISNDTGSNGTATTLAAGTTTITAASGSISGSTTLTVIANNLLAITVNGLSYLNKPSVSVQVCAPGTSDCQTIHDILLDTGSSGLRIFKQVLNVNLPQLTVVSGSLAECVQFGDGSSLWGPVRKASVVLGNEPAVDVPIQVIDFTFGAPSSACGNADQNPTVAGYSGILGVGLFVQDCGKACETNSTIGIYYSCNGSTCSGTAVPPEKQVQNPAALLPQDNNGVLVRLPSVPPGGSPSVNGSLVLGIGTQSNNAPSAVTTYAADQYGEFTTNLYGTSYSSFIDTGSNGLFFASPDTSLLPDCGSPYGSWFCPASTTSLSATNTGAGGSPSGDVSFQIGNFVSLYNSSNGVFAEIGGDFPGVFDWGLPFFFGRNVYVGFEGRDSSLGTGPYWAY